MIVTYMVCVSLIPFSKHPNAKPVKHSSRMSSESKALSKSGSELFTYAIFLTEARPFLDPAKWAGHEKNPIASITVVCEWMVKAACKG